MRDDFTARTKQVLAKRVGYFCSRPNCRRITLAPDSTAFKAIVFGIASHISGASPLGPRYDARLTPAQRQSIQNGIWLCRDCSHEVDQDEVAFPSSLLRQWKDETERHLRRAHSPRPDLIAVTDYVPRAAAVSPALADQVHSPEAPPAVTAALAAAVQHIDAGSPGDALPLLKHLLTTYRDTVTDEMASHLYYQLARVHYASGRPHLAARYFRAAGALGRDLIHRTSCRALAREICGSTERAFAYLHPHLASFSAHPLAAAIWIRTAPRQTHPIAIRQVAELHPRSPAVNNAYSNYLLDSGDIDHATTLIRRLYLTKRSNSIAAVFATALLRQASHYVTLHQEPSLRPLDRLRLKIALRLFNGVIASNPDRPDAVIYSNRAGAHSLLGDYVASRADADMAYRLAPTNPDYAYQHALHIAKESPAAALDLLATSPGSTTDPHAAVFLAQLLLQRGQPADLGKAHETLSTILPNAAKMPENFRFGYAVQLAEVVSKLTGLAAATTALDSLPPRFLDALSLEAALVRVEHEHGDAAAVQKRIPRLLGYIAGSSYAAHRRCITLLRSIGRNDIALDVLLRVADPSRRSGHLSDFVFCASQVDRYDIVVIAAETLMAHGMASDVTRNLLVDALLKANELRKVIRLLQRLIQDGSNAPWWRFRLTTIGIELDQPALIERDPSQLPPPDTLPLHTRYVLAQVLRYTSAPTLSCQLAYRLLREHFEDAEAHRTLLASLLAPFGPEVSLEVPDTAGPGAGIRYVQNGRPHILIIEDEYPPKPSLCEVAADSFIAQQLQGKKSGSWFRNSASSLDSDCQITLVTSKYVLRLQDSMEEWEVRFPTDSHLTKIDVPEIGGQHEQDIVRALLLRTVAPRAQSIDRVLAEYSANLLPLAVVARVRGDTVFETMIGLSETRKCELRVNSGSMAERVDTQQSLKGIVARSGSLVIDSTALATIVMLDLVDTLANSPFRFVITEGLLESVRQTRHRAESSADNMQLYAEGAYLRVSQPQAGGVADSLRHLDKLLTWLDGKCIVEGGMAAYQLGHEQRIELLRAFSPPEVEALGAAVNSDRILWTDDHALACLGASVGVHSRVWSQAVLMYLVENGFMTADDFNRRCVGLVFLRHSHTSFTHAVVLKAARMAAWDAQEEPLRACVRLFADRRITSASISEIAARVLGLAWRECRLHGAIDKFIVSIASSLMERHDGRGIIVDLLSRLDAVFGLDVIARQDTERILRGIIGSRMN